MGSRGQGAGGRGQGKRPFPIPSLSFWPSFTPWYKFISLLSLPCHKNQRQLQKFSPGTNWALAHLDKTLQSLGKVILNHRLDALPRPGLEPMSSGLEPSALTTGLLNKAVALACLQYSWLRMLKVAPCTVVRLYGHTVVWSYIQIFSAWWVTTILYNYGATPCELR